MREIVKTVATWLTWLASIDISEANHAEISEAAGALASELEGELLNENENGENENGAT